MLPADADAELRRAVVRALGVALVLLSVAACGSLLSRTLALNGGVWPSLFADMQLALRETHFGRVWLWRLPALALLWLAWGWSMRHDRAPVACWLMLLGVAAIALTRSQTGHAADHGDWTVAVAIDWAHLMAAGAWVGSVFAMSLVIFPRLLRAGTAAVGWSAEIFQRLSTLSGAALAVVLAAGIYNAVTRLGSVAALWTTPYGIILDVKLSIVLAMILIGAHNRYSKLPRLLLAAGRPAAATAAAAPRPTPAISPRPSAAASSAIVRMCARAVLLETGLGVAVIGVTAVLLQALPPADMPAMTSGKSRPNNAAALGSERVGTRTDSGAAVAMRSRT